MNEIAAVINRQRREGEQQRGDQARDETEHLHARTEQQNHGAADEHRREPKLGFGQPGKVFRTEQFYDGFGQAKKRRAVAVLRIVVETFAGQQFTGNIGVDGFVRVHRPFAEPGQTDGQREQRDANKDRPADFG